MQNEAESDRVSEFGTFFCVSTETSTGVLRDVDGQTDVVRLDTHGHFGKRNSRAGRTERSTL